LTFKAIKPQIEDMKAKGPEPEFKEQPDQESRQSAIMWSYNWYSYICDKKQAKKWIVQWLTTNSHTTLLKSFSSIKDSWIPQTAAWLVRMQEAGLELTAKETSYILDATERAITSNNENKEDSVNEEKTITNRPNIQEIMIERAHEAAGDIDEVWDTYVSGDIKASEKPKIQQFLAAKNVLAQHVTIIKDQWIKHQKEIQDAVIGTDADLSEGYSCYTKTQQKNMINYCAAIIAELDAYHQSKKAKVGVRRKKAVSPEKQVSKLKLLRKFEEFKLETVDPTRILTASELWVYNTKNRKLQYYVADEYSKTFTVKGASILGYDTNKSSQKTLRKPADTLKELRGAGKPDSRKLFDTLKTTSIAVNGRFNENLIIIKAT